MVLAGGCRVHMHDSLNKAWWCEGDMLQRRRFDTRGAPFKIIGVAISSLQIPVDGTQFEVICPP